MAKTFYTSGTGSQQTLTSSQNEKVAIYQTLADAQADLANLEAGQIVATPDTGDELAQPVDVVESGNMHAVTSNAVANSNAMPVNEVTINNLHSVTSNAVASAVSTINTKIDNIYHQGVKYGNYDCNTLSEGVALINEQVLHSPLKEGLVETNIMYIVTMCINTNSSSYRFQLCLTYRADVLCIRTYTDSGWSSWVKIN